MKLVGSNFDSGEPLWEDFTFEGTDFRPQWNGDLVNVFTTIRPLSTAEDTERFAVDCVRKMAGWVVDEHGRFGVEDRFQIIVGWPKDVRESGRQTVKVGGGFEELRGMVSGLVPILMRPGWATEVWR